MGLVDAITATIDATVAEGELSHSAKTLRNVATSAAGATEQLMASAHVITDETARAATQTAQVNVATQHASRTLDHVGVSMASITTLNTQLAAATQQISNMVGLIETIAEQTNLLALNATIEAARAGEAGKGFSVVADEVRKLAGQTRGATESIAKTVKDISSLMENVTAATQSTHTSVQESVKAVRDITHATEQVDNVMGQIRTATREQEDACTQLNMAVKDVMTQTQQNETAMATIASVIHKVVSILEEQRALLAKEDIPLKVIYLAKADHLLWKKKMIDFELGRINLRPEDASDHTLCRLGKWYYAEGKTVFGKKHAFQAMEAPHATLHTVAREALALRQREPKADISLYRARLNEASAQVVRYLDDLLSEAHQRRAA